jgi:hypothetical protein
LIGIEALGTPAELRPLELLMIDCRRSISPSRLSTAFPTDQST